MLGLGLTYFGVQFFLLLLPADVPEWMRLTLDFRVVLFVTFAAVSTAVLAMVLPAAQQLRANLNDVLKQGSRGSSQGHTFAAWARKSLVVAEVALSLILLIGAGLMIRSFQQAMDTDSGLKTGQLLIVETGKFVANVKKESAVRAYCDDYRRIQLALSALPGVSSASAGSLIPFLGKTILLNIFMDLVLCLLFLQL